MTEVAERRATRVRQTRPLRLGWLASRRWRIFLIAWLVYSAHFATNVVREHYPAFSLVEHGTVRVDEYQGLHPDIFVHRDGHSVIGNQVFVSVLAAVPLLIFDPVLDALEAHSKRKLTQQGLQNAEYRTDKPLQVRFFRLVKERGLDLRFGAATVVTSAFFMAPLTALFLVLIYGVLIGRGVARDDATWLTFLLGFGTPLFFRASVLSHNTFVMFGMFISYLLLARHGGRPVPLRDRLLAGFFGGITLATDYIGVMILPLLYGYLLLERSRTAPWTTSLRESFAYVAGTIPPVLFLLYTQWAMYGNPFLPGQHWMPDQNIYTDLGMRGITLPAWDLLLLNLFEPSYGLFAWAPIFLLSFLPGRFRDGEWRVSPRREFYFILLCFVVLLLFNSANQYARLQFSGGLRYMLPLVPFLLLPLADRWLRLARPLRIGITVFAVLNAWVLTVFREPVHQSWLLLFREGPQLPWLRVLRMTSAPGSWFAEQPVPSLLLAATIGLAWLIWHRGARLEAARSRPVLITDSS